ncbi:MAG TPA: hypothetical protein DCW29_22290 [Janthinobacterium sp.]|nr:hypothetical protein [Janthinobacterium sp.]
MNTTKIFGAILILGGILGLVVGGFSYTKETHAAKLGPLELSMSEQQTVNIPLWASIAAIAAGTALVVMGGKKS